MQPHLGELGLSNTFPQKELKSLRYEIRANLPNVSHMIIQKFNTVVYGATKHTYHSIPEILGEKKEYEKKPLLVQIY